MPSIIVLQPGVQLADPHYGHVGVVEKVNADGSVYTSDLNWGPTASAQASVSNVTFHIGSGVDFIWVGGATSNGSTYNAVAITSFLQKVGQQQLNPSADVAGVLEALDTALKITNPFDTSAYTNTNIAILGQDTGLPNPIAWTAEVATNMINNSAAILIRTMFIILGGLILWKVSSAFIDYGQIYETAQSGAASVAKLAVLA